MSHAGVDRHRARRMGRLLPWAVLLAAAVVAVAGCGTGGSGPSYGPGAAVTGAAGIPAQIDLTVTGVVPIGPGGGQVVGLARTAAGTTVVLTGPDASGNGAALGELTADQDYRGLRGIDVDAAYLQAAGASPQIEAGWALGALPAAGPQALAVATGTRYGVLGDVLAGPGMGGYAGVRTDAKGSPTGPVTGVCGDRDGVSDQVTWTVSGSDVLERRTLPTIASTGAAPSVVMSASPMMGLRDAQRGEATRVGAHEVPRLTPAQVYSVGGLRGLDCLDPQQISFLAGAGAVGLRSSDNTSLGLVSVVDRGLADHWFTEGSAHPGTTGAVRAGQHYSASLVGQATASGPHRLDAVVIDAITGTAVAGLHLSGPGVPDDAQVSALLLDADGRGGLAAIAGGTGLYRFTVPSGPSR